MTWGGVSQIAKIVLTSLMEAPLPGCTIYPYWRTNALVKKSGFYQAISNLAHFTNQVGSKTPRFVRYARILGVVGHLVGNPNPCTVFGELLIWLESVGFDWIPSVLVNVANDQNHYHQSGVEEEKIDPRHFRWSSTKRRLPTPSWIQSKAIYIRSR